eukprot:TRINITY_DN75250_c0_g1_i1.p1 TRINITY_DN75250_c0_g1~~TRINITY_DN75250_c0_g1_i1.p1  ORF type:complete len:655 (-),score=123.99 TRINITY_DN75250_c0_g1_i1:36-2000(-)
MLSPISIVDDGGGGGGDGGSRPSFEAALAAQFEQIWALVAAERERLLSTQHTATLEHVGGEMASSPQQLLGVCQIQAEDADAHAVECSRPDDSKITQAQPCEDVLLPVCAPRQLFSDGIHSAAADQINEGESMLKGDEPHPPDNEQDGGSQALATRRVKGSNTNGSSNMDGDGSEPVAPRRLKKQHTNPMIDLEAILMEARDIAKADAEGGNTKRRFEVEITKAGWEGIFDDLVEPFVSAVIIVNAIITGVSCDVQRDWIGWFWIDVSFNSFYLVECVLKAYFCGVHDFFFGHGCEWSRFDVVVITLGTVDNVLTGLAMSGGEPRGTTPAFVLLRILRLTRITRMARLLQFKMFRELFCMLAGLMSGLRTLMWAFVLLLFPTFSLGLFLTQSLGHMYPEDTLIQEHFGALPTSMLMVFRCSIGDCSFNNGTPAILYLSSEFGWMYGAGYIVMTMFITFGIFNLVMATFVDNSLAAARRNEIIRMRSRLQDQHRQGRIIAAFIEKVWEHVRPEDSARGHMDVEEALHVAVNVHEFNRIAQDPEVQDLLEDLDVPEDDRIGLFDVLDADGGGSLELEELIHGIVKLRGDPRRSDVIHVGLVCRCLQDELRNFKETTEMCLEDISKRSKATQKQLCELKSQSIFLEDQTGSKKFVAV